MNYFERQFENNFDKPEISVLRLLLFGKDVLSRLTKANTQHQYDDPISWLTDVLSTLATEVGNVDINKNIQFGKTYTVVQLTNLFHHTMSDLEGAIAVSLGGRDSEGYKEFYPAGITEYNHPSRETALLLVNRVARVTNKYATKLGNTITQELLLFAPAMNAARENQVDAKTDVNTSRGERNNSILDVEKALNKVMNFISMMYPFDTIKCNSFFNFNLLFTITHHKHHLVKDSLDPNQTKAVANRQFTDNVQLRIRNVGTNASLKVWLAETATASPNNKAVELKVGDSILIKPSDIGNLKDTFLLVCNSSSINTAMFEIDIIG